MNKAILMGRLTADPELRNTQKGKSVTSFTLAVNRRTKSDEQTQADFIDVVAWEKTAEFVSRYFVKGQQVSVVGRIQTRTYEDKNGNKRKAVEVVAEEVFFADSKRDRETSGGYEAPAADPMMGGFAPLPDASDDLPF